ncbi:MAG: PfkB family carbohydrate kinase, partial [Thermanaerothrix sp.]|nr:PfkB family carbohydrate kinase [Thermanaerothrix sp.]
EEWGIDTQGIRRENMPTLRAWQLLEPDGRRTQIWRVPQEALAVHLARKLEWLPISYRQARGYHLGVHPLEERGEFIEELRNFGGVISLEPFKPADDLPDPKVLQRLVSLADIFSPNLEEAISLVGPGEPFDLVTRFLDAGAPIVILRMGPQGVLIGQQGLDHLVFVPPVPVDVVDPIGAGNAFCGGFLVGWVKTGDLVEAGLRGAVSASFLVTQVGLPRMEMALALQMAQERLQLLRSQVKTLPLR